MFDLLIVVVMGELVLYFVGCLRISFTDLAAIELLPESPDYQGPEARAILAEGFDNYSEAELRQLLVAHNTPVGGLKETKAAREPKIRR